MWGFSQLPDTRSRTLTFAEDDRDTSCMTKVFRNESAKGGMAMSAEAIPWRSGRACFVVEILEMRGRGAEGLEIGITDASPERFIAHPTYAVLSRPSWVSSDAGCCWRHGTKLSRLSAWSEVKPIRLKSGDRVQFCLDMGGGMEVYVNGRLQVRWQQSDTDAPIFPKPVYALVGLRAPLMALSIELGEVPPSHASGS